MATPASARAGGARVLACGHLEPQAGPRSRTGDAGLAADRNSPGGAAGHGSPGLAGHHRRRAGGQPTHRPLAAGGGGHRGGQHAGTGRLGPAPAAHRLPARDGAPPRRRRDHRAGGPRGDDDQRHRGQFRPRPVGRDLRQGFLADLGCLVGRRRDGRAAGGALPAQRCATTTPAAHLLASGSRAGGPAGRHRRRHLRALHEPAAARVSGPPAHHGDGLEVSAARRRAGRADRLGSGHLGGCGRSRALRHRGPVPEDDHAPGLQCERGRRLLPPGLLRRHAGTAGGADPALRLVTAGQRRQELLSQHGGPRAENAAFRAGRLSLHAVGRLARRRSQGMGEPAPDTDGQDPRAERTGG